MKKTQLESREELKKRDDNPNAWRKHKYMVRRNVPVVAEWSNPYYAQQNEQVPITVEKSTFSVHDYLIGALGWLVLIVVMYLLYF